MLKWSFLSRYCTNAISFLFFVFVAHFFYKLFFFRNFKNCSIFLSKKFFFFKHVLFFSSIFKKTPSSPLHPVNFFFCWSLSTCVWSFPLPGSYSIHSSLLNSSSAHLFISVHTLYMYKHESMKSSNPQKPQMAGRIQLKELQSREFLGPIARLGLSIEYKLSVIS